MNKSKDLDVLLSALQAEKAELQALSNPLRAERDSLLASIQPTLNQIRELEKQHKQIEQPRLAELDNQISALVRAKGARTMSSGNVN